MGVGAASCTRTDTGFLGRLFAVACLGFSGLVALLVVEGSAAGAGSGADAGTTIAATGVGVGTTGAVADSGSEAVAVELFEGWADWPIKK